MGQVIGITGGIASGKSTVSSYIREELGYIIIDADIAARVVAEPGEKAFNQIVEAFGQEIIGADGSINRPRLGAIIFHNEEKRLLLNSIVHPAVRAWMNEQKELAFLRGENTVFMDIPLLFESNLTHMVDKTILVYVDPDIQLGRLMNRNQLDEKEAKARISSQMPLTQKKELADVVIDNNGDISETKRQVKAALHNMGIL
ncbi:dephospho-CoA kinase [Peribacillus sp. SCS-155]|uniref:dephospho-CoA kinase n=1 Tax=Peribacillus sedimenti TaxID=3115297 RepID=UPI003905AD9B